MPPVLERSPLSPSPAAAPQVIHAINPAIRFPGTTHTTPGLSHLISCAPLFSTATTTAL
jgi:hypothetical protein